jgi:glycosyltransferase involved in cell wall biosynthesis
MSSTNLEIIHFITTIERGGAEKQLIYLVEEQIKRGNRVSIVYLKGKPLLESTFLSIGVEVICIKRILNCDNLSKFLGILFRRGSVIFHGHLPRAELLCLLLSILARKPFVVSRHNAEHFVSGGSKLLSRLVSKIVTTFAFTIVAISFAVRDFLLEEGEISDINKIKVVYYGFDMQTFNRLDPCGPATSIKHPDLGKKRILALSRLEPQKNLLALVEAVAPVIEIGNYELHIYGEGSQRKKLEHKILALGLEERIKLMGKTNEVANVLLECDLLVLPSLYEGFGMILFEAMATDCRIAGSSVSAIPEVLGIDYPFLFDPRDTLMMQRVIVECLNYDGEYFYNFNKKRLSLFPIDNTFTQLNQIYLDALKVNNKEI